MNPTCTITCNGEALTAEGTVADLLRARLGDPPRSGIAVAVNGEVVPRATWPGVVLTDGDVVEVVTAVQGG
ncbi:sulfur carrier protein [Nocardioides aromaticivorans]|uniref:Sulfur carrier protein n=1 Tax=Nocardioides aromaticivorans TaxID=200618 RepID=A0A7Y9ZG56_9ACTN|nr:sulfur carrier protein ThiS [Nocardioides aromaticivorans]NYI43923.1 sulfur carrier protein [Nocardioides aromaticivorans]QSR27883.1 thiamine biosynthesis protein ThiS [Nocardioides aromaticivorans]